MKKFLVVYYSLTGNTEKVARLIAKRLDADIEVIRDNLKRKATPARFNAILEAIFKMPAVIEESRHQVDQYECIILGGPVWAQNMSSPMRSYIKRESQKFRRLALFCTENSEGGEKMLSKAARLSSKIPIASMVLTEKDVQSDELDRKIAEFIDSVEAAFSLTSREG